MVWLSVTTLLARWALLRTGLFVLFGTATLVVAEDAKPQAQLAEQPLFIAANAAQADGLYEVAAVKWRRLLESQKWSKKERLMLTALVAETLVRGGNAAEALRFIDAHDFPDAPYWRGQSLLLTGSFIDAETAFHNYPPTGPLAAYAKLGASHAFIGQGREGSARRECKDLRSDSNAEIARYSRLLFNELELGSDRTQTVYERLEREKIQVDGKVQYLRARALTEKGLLTQAEVLLRQLLALKTASERLHDSATILLAEVLWRQGRAEGQTLLVSFMNSLTLGILGNRTDTDYWAEAFDLLSRIAISTKAEKKLMDAAIAWLASSVAPVCRGHAKVFIAQEMYRTGRDTEALGMLEGFIQTTTHHAKLNDALRLAMQLHGAAHSDQRVLDLAQRWRQDFGSGDASVVDFLVGMIRFARGEYTEALALFTQAAAVESDGTSHRRALYNAAIAAIQAGEKVALASLITQLTPVAQALPVTPPPPSAKPVPFINDAADVKLDQALQLAAKGDLSAEISLGTFVRENPQNPRCPEAHIALAEIALLDVPPRVKPASEALAAAAASPNLPPHLAERIGYVRVWMREAAGELPLVTREGTTFLEHWPKSAHAAEVRMKVGEAYYRLEDYPNARTQFELLDKEQPDSPYADAALFFAGKAAMNLTSTEGLNAAIDLWDELAERAGPLAFAARQHQALAKRRLGQETEALSMIESLLDQPEAKANVRLSLIAEKAELLLLLGKSDPRSIEATVTLLTETLQDKSLPYLWAARLGFMKSRALKELGRVGESLEACYDVVSVGSEPLTAPTTPAEFQWYYLAGFQAIGLLEQTQQWEAAARIAEKLAQSSGARAADAKQRATDIRLVHFLWDGAK